MALRDILPNESVGIRPFGITPIESYRGLESKKSLF